MLQIKKIYLWNYITSLRCLFEKWLKLHLFPQNRLWHTYPTIQIILAECWGKKNKYLLDVLYKSLSWNAIVTVDLLSFEQPEVKVSAKPNNKTIKSLGIGKKVWNQARNLECLPKQQESLFNYFQSGRFFSWVKEDTFRSEQTHCILDLSFWLKQTQAECHISKSNQKDKKPNFGLQNSFFSRLDWS